MRTANLVFLILFAAASCDMRVSSRSAVAAEAGASLPAAISSQEEPEASPSAAVCGYSFEPASREEATSFLRELSGLWRDELSAPTLVDGNAVVDGLIVNERGIIPASLPADGGTAGAILRLNPEGLAIGPVSADGFRIVQLTMSGEPACLVYGLKIERNLKGGPASLLVRGPLSPMGATAAAPAAFQATTYDSTRIFKQL